MVKRLTFSLSLMSCPCATSIVSISLEGFVYTLGHNGAFLWPVSKALSQRPWEFSVCSLAPCHTCEEFIAWHHRQQFQGLYSPVRLWALRRLSQSDLRPTGQGPWPAQSPCSWWNGANGVAQGHCMKLRPLSSGSLLLVLSNQVSRERDCFDSRGRDFF